MRNSGRVLLIVLVAVVTSLSLISCGGGGSSSSSGSASTRFTSLDLQGTWALHGVSTGLTLLTNKGGWHVTQPGGDLVISSSDNILSGSLSIEGILVDPNLSGTMTIDTSGLIGGTILTDHGFSFYLASGLMDISKTSMVYIDTTDSASMPYDLAVMIKKGGVFLGTNIQGDWHMFGLCSRAGLAADFGAIYGDLSINVAGTPSGTFNLAGTAHAISGGSFSLNASGEIVVGSTLIADSTWTVSSGKLDQSKTFGVFTSTTGGTPDIDMVVIIQESGTVLKTSDLAGTWHIFGATAGQAADGTITGTIVIGSTGAVTSGSISIPGTLAGLTITGGSFSLAANGATTGSFVVSGFGTITIQSGWTDESKQMMALTDTSDNRLYILHK